jgi:hypothetical protein
MGLTVKLSDLCRAWLVPFEGDEDVELLVVDSEGYGSIQDMSAREVLLSRAIRALSAVAAVQVHMTKAVNREDLTSVTYALKCISLISNRSSTSAIAVVGRDIDVPNDCRDASQYHDCRKKANKDVTSWLRGNLDNHGLKHNNVSVFLSPPWNDLDYGAWMYVEAFGEIVAFIQSAVGATSLKNQRERFEAAARQDAEWIPNMNSTDSPRQQVRATLRQKCRGEIDRVVSDSKAKLESKFGNMDFNELIDTDTRGSPDANKAVETFTVRCRHFDEEIQLDLGAEFDDLCLEVYNRVLTQWNITYGRAKRKFAVTRINQRIITAIHIGQEAIRAGREDIDCIVKEATESVFPKDGDFGGTVNEFTPEQVDDARKTIKLALEKYANPFHSEGGPTFGDPKLTQTRVERVMGFLKAPGNRAVIPGVFVAMALPIVPFFLK